MSRLRRKVLVIGVDGATWDQMLPMIKRGELPTFARLMREGSWGELESTYRNNSISAWMALLTGQNPGRFGMYGFEQSQAGSYDSRIVDSRGRLGSTLLRRLGAAGCRVTAINVPPIYPPEPVNGVLVTGILTPDKSSGYTYPPEFATELEGAVPGYLVEPSVFVSGNEARYLGEVEESTRSTLEAWRYLFKKEDWDFSIAVFVAPDRVQHFFWHHIDPEHPLHTPETAVHYGRAIRETYRRMDEVLGEIVSELDGDTALIIASDHGFGPCRRAFNMSEWLEREGFLAHGKRQPDPACFDFIEHLLDAEIETPILDYAAVKETMFSISRNWRRVLFQHPPCTLRWRCLIPPKSVFRASIALDPRTWHAGRGTGARFLFKVNGEPLMEREIDPKQRLDDRRWHEIEVDLSEYASHAVDVELVTSYEEGAQGTFAWAGWANPRLVSTDPTVPVERSVEDEEWVDWSRTRAYSYDDVSIRLNVRGREPEGIVEEGEEYEALRTDLIHRLEAIPHPERSGRLISRVWRREEVCHGPHLDDEAGLIIEFADPSWTIGVPANSGTWTVGSEKSAAAQWGPTGPTYPSGNHRPNGILLAWGAGVLPGGRLTQTRIIDIAPTVMHLLGFAVPEDVDGRPLSSIVAPTATADLRPLPHWDATASEEVYSAQDEALVRRRLAALGYVEE